MKIVNYVHKAFPKPGNQKTIDLQTVFLSRLTCEYCQDVFLQSLLDIYGS